MNNKSRLQRNSLSELPTSPLVAYQPSSDRENLTPTRDVTPFHRHPSQQVMVDGSLDGPTQPLPIPKNASQFMHKPGQRFSNGRRSRRIAVLWCCIGLFVLATALSSLSLYQNYSGQYHHDMTLARSGIQHLQTAETLIKNLARGAFDVHNVTQARQEFTAAFTVFSQLKNDLTQIPSAATLLPKYGTLVSAALHIVPLAV